MKAVTVCADDYSLNRAVSLGIVQLAEGGRLTAISCLTNTTHWAQHAAWLLPFQDRLDIGLHFNLTQGQALSGEQRQFGSLAALIVNAYYSRIDSQAIEQEFLQQLQAFEHQLHRFPDFIDGHQHVHQLPVVRNAWLKVYQQQLRAHGTYIRLPIQSSFDLKSTVIASLGARALRSQLIVQQIPYNHSFAGIYSFNQAKNYPQYFRRFLAMIDNGGLIMCHPAHPASSEQDTIASSRVYEWQYLNSAEFIEDCASYEVRLQRFYSAGEG